MIFKFIGYCFFISQIFLILTHTCIYNESFTLTGASASESALPFNKIECVKSFVFWNNCIRKQIVIDFLKFEAVIFIFLDQIILLYQVQIKNFLQGAV